MFSLVPEAWLKLLGSAEKETYLGCLHRGKSPGLEAQGLSCCLGIENRFLGFRVAVKCEIWLCWSLLWMPLGWGLMAPFTSLLKFSEDRSTRQEFLPRANIWMLLTENIKCNQSQNPVWLKLQGKPFPWKKSFNIEISNQGWWCLNACLEPYQQSGGHGPAVLTMLSFFKSELVIRCRAYWQVHSITPDWIRFSWGKKCLKDIITEPTKLSA